MPGLSEKTTIREYQNFIKEIYGKSNERHFSLGDMLSNVQRFSMRALKGIRKNDYDKTKKNLLISMSWFMSTLNRLHIDLEDSAWKRFPYLCSYCASSPCSCKESGLKERKDVPVDDSKKPVTFDDFQKMFRNLYPPEKRTIEHAGVHLAEELGEFSEAILAYRGEHKDESFERIVQESADIFSCIVGVFNSLGVDMSKELSDMFSKGCHECGKLPCECAFNTIMNFES